MSASHNFVTKGWGTHMGGAEPMDYFTSKMDGAIIMLIVDGSD